jgi:hypothetical protein
VSLLVLSKGIGEDQTSFWVTQTRPSCLSVSNDRLSGLLTYSEAVLSAKVYQREETDLRRVLHRRRWGSDPSLSTAGLVSLLILSMLKRKMERTSPDPVT